MRLRWPETGGEPVCPRCECARCYDCRRAGGQARWRCSACRHDFSITSGTLFAWHKLPLRLYLLATVLVCDEVKGKSMLALVRDLGVQYKSAFVLAHKLREAMASSPKGLRLGGEGRVAEVDGAFFGGHVRPENRVADRVDRRLARAARANGRSWWPCASAVAAPCRGWRRPRRRWSRACASGLPRAPCCTLTRARPGTRCTPASRCAGSTISRATAWTVPAPTARRPSSPACAAARSATTTTSPGPISSATLSNGEQAHGVVKLAMRLAPSVDFCGYWQRSRAA